MLLGAAITSKPQVRYSNIQYGMCCGIPTSDKGGQFTTGHEAPVELSHSDSKAEEGGLGHEDQAYRRNYNQKQGRKNSPSHHYLPSTLGDPSFEDRATSLATKHNGPS